MYLAICSALGYHILQDGRWVVWSSKIYCMEIRSYPTSWIQLHVDFYYSLQRVAGKPSRFSLVSNAEFR